MYRTSKLKQTIDLWPQIKDMSTEQALEVMVSHVGVKWRTAEIYHVRISAVLTNQPGTSMYTRAIEIIRRMYKTNSMVEIHAELTNQLGSSPTTIRGFMAGLIPTIKYLDGNTTLKEQANIAYKQMWECGCSRKEILEKFVGIGLSPATSEGYFREFKRGYRVPKKPISCPAESII